MTCRRLGTVGPRMIGVEAVTLAAHRTSYPIQSVSANALSAHQKSFTGLTDSDAASL